MDASSVITSCFTLELCTTPVAGTVSYSGVTATFTPAANLAPLTTYTATISTGAKDLAGNALASDMSWSFTTGVIPDTTAPTVSATVPANATTGVGITAQLATTFSEPMDASTINTSTFTLKQGTTPVARSEEHTSELQSLTNLVCRLLLANTTATISTGTKYLAVHVLTTATTSDFSTLSLHDALPISVSATVPANATTGVGITAQLATTFSEPMDVSTINTSTFTLKQGTTPVAGTVSYSGVTATFTPAANLAPLTTYTATIDRKSVVQAKSALRSDSRWIYTK